MHMYRACGELLLTVQVPVVWAKVIIVELAGAGQDLVLKNHHTLLNVLQDTNSISSSSSSNRHTVGRSC